jgi:integrase
MSDRKYVGSGVAGLKRRPAPNPDGTITYKSTVWGPGIGANGHSQNRAFPAGRDDGLSAAARWHAERQQAREEGELPVPKGVTIDDVWRVAAENRRAELVRANKNLGSLENFEAAYRLRIQPTLGRVKLSDLNVAASPLMLAWLRRLREQGVPQQTRYATLVCLRFILREALAQRWLTRDPLAGIPKRELPSQRKPKGWKPTRAITVSEAASLAEAARTPRFAQHFRRKDSGVLVYALVVLVYGGQRASELLGLRWQDVNLEAGRFETNGQLPRGGRYRHPSSEKTETKTEQDRSTPILDIVAWAFRAQFEHERSKRLGGPDDFVFTTHTGRPFGRYALSNAVTVAAGIAGLGHLTAQNCRTTFSTAVADAGVGSKQGSEWVGNTENVFDSNYKQPVRDEERERGHVRAVQQSGFGVIPEEWLDD